MARYAITRQRTMRGLGATYSFVPRRRGLRGLGQTSDLDPITGLPCSDPASNCPPVFTPTFPSTPPPLAPPPPRPEPPPGFFTFPAPIIPPQKTVPLTPPVITPTFPSTPPGIQIVFPSGGGAPRPLVAAAPSWLEQTTGGFPNKYLALFGIGAALLLSTSAGARRR